MMPLTEMQIERIATAAATHAAKQAVEEAANLAAAKVSLHRAEVNQVVAEAVKQTLIQLGVDTSDPLAMQRDFQHLRQWRQSGDSLRDKGMLAILGIFLSGLAALLVMGVREWMHR
jgi:uncharacterized protein involved in exopolysaccharide biosynthesis